MERITVAFMFIVVFLTGVLVIKTNPDELGKFGANIKIAYEKELATHAEHPNND